MSEVETVRQAFVQLWGSMGHFWGISPTTARIYSWLLSRPEPADTDDIMQALEMSRGAVSMACRELREWHLIFPEKAPGSRRVTYRPATDLEKVIRNIVEIRKRREWDPILESLREWIPQLESDGSPEAAVFRQRLEDLESLITLTDSMVKVFLRGGVVGKLGLKMLVKAARDDAFRDNSSRDDAFREDGAEQRRLSVAETEVVPMSDIQRQDSLAGRAESAYRKALEESS